MNNGGMDEKDDEQRCYGHNTVETGDFSALFLFSAWHWRHSEVWNSYMVLNVESTIHVRPESGMGSKAWQLLLASTLLDHTLSSALFWAIQTLESTPG